jgi:hypothetical protein
MISGIASAPQRVPARKTALNARDPHSRDTTLATSSQGWNTATARSATNILQSDRRLCSGPSGARTAAVSCDDQDTVVDSQRAARTEQVTQRGR